VVLVVVVQLVVVAAVEAAVAPAAAKAAFAGRTFPARKRGSAAGSLLSSHLPRHLGHSETWPLAIGTGVLA
jgi:hypothetical protein